MPAPLARVNDNDRCIQPSLIPNGNVNWKKLSARALSNADPTASEQRDSADPATPDDIVSATFRKTLENLGSNVIDRSTRNRAIRRPNRLWVVRQPDAALSESVAHGRTLWESGPRTLQNA